MTVLTSSDPTIKFFASGMREFGFEIRVYNLKRFSNPMAKMLAEVTAYFAVAHLAAT